MIPNKKEPQGSFLLATNLFFVIIFLAHREFHAVVALPLL